MHTGLIYMMIGVNIACCNSYTYVESHDSLSDREYPYLKHCPCPLRQGTGKLREIPHSQTLSRKIEAISASIAPHAT